jgi:putative flippase GtrA
MSLLRYQPVRYYCIGFLAVSADVALYQSLVLAGAAPVISAIVAYGIIGSLHFLASRIWTFAAFHRPATSQVSAYVFVVACAWVATAFLVAWGVESLHESAIQAKLVAVLLTTPIGYFGHKYITFGRSHHASVQALRLKVDAWRQNYEIKTRLLEVEDANVYESPFR